MTDYPSPNAPDSSNPATPFYTPTDEAPSTTTPSALAKLSPEEAHKAAALIQRNYRGHRERRQLAGIGTDGVSKRWVDAVDEAQWRNATKSRPRNHPGPNSGLSTNARRESAQNGAHSTFAQQEWKRLLQIARRADNDDTSGSDSEKDEHISEAQREADRQKRHAEKKKREKYARTMGLEYFLEMVDEKHRYGSHLRAYHAAWKDADTNENFFFWLDHGDGQTVEVPTCTREVLERDQVRYLNREERQKYLVKVDKDGRLRWDKNNERLSTSYEYKDSMDGIVRADDDSHVVFREPVHGKRHPQQDPYSTTAVDHERRKSGSVSSSSSSSSDSVDSAAEGQHYVNRELEDTHGIKKVQYVSAGALLNHLLQKTTRKNTWIFVADTSFRLYVGIKQSGAFQHSSFLHGSRVAAAGLIKVKDGQLRSLSPLSGHYRPPTKNFRAFVHSLHDAGVDMSRVSISKSYAVLLGIEGYIKTKKSMHQGMTIVEHKTEEIFHPEQARQREEKARDKSESAKKEREFLAKQEEADRKAKRENWIAKKMKDNEADGESEGLLRRFKTLGRKMRKSSGSTPEKERGDVSSKQTT